MKLTALHYIILAIVYFAVLILLGILAARQKEKIRSAEEENRAYRRAFVWMTAPLVLSPLVGMFVFVGLLLLSVLLKFMPDLNPILLGIIVILYLVLSIFWGIKACIAIYKLYAKGRKGKGSNFFM